MLQYFDVESTLAHSQDPLTQVSYKGYCSALSSSYRKVIRLRSVVSGCLWGSEGFHQRGTYIINPRRAFAARVSCPV